MKQKREIKRKMEMKNENEIKNENEKRKMKRRTDMGKNFWKIFMKRMYMHIQQ